MDLLLHLVSQYQMDIYQVPLIEVIEQYLAYISTLQALRLEVAGDYMVMASQLTLIKSRRLLPKVVEEPVFEEDPEQLLLSQLEEYRQFKALSEKLEEQHQERAHYFSKPKEELVYEDVTLIKDKSTIDIFLAFSKVMAEKQEDLRLSHTTIAREEYKIEDMMGQIRQEMTHKGDLTLRQLFAHSQDKQHMITLFLAVLELIKVKEITVEQTETFGEVKLSLAN